MTRSRLWFFLLPLALMLVLWFWRPRVSVDEGATAAGERLRGERVTETQRYELRIDELEVELERVRKERRRVDKILTDIQRLALVLLGALVVLCAAAAPTAHAGDGPAYRLSLDGRLCFAASDAAMMLGAGANAPRMRLELKTLHADRELAAQEIKLLEGLRASSNEQLAAALGRETRWATIERELSGRVQSLERELADGQKRRRRWVAVGVAVGAGVVLGLVVVR